MSKDKETVVDMQALSDGCSDKKIAKNLAKDEKKQLKNSKKQEKLQIKQNKKAEKQKINELLKQRKLEEKQLRKTQEQTLRELEKRGKLQSWFRLDNAASIYPSASVKDWNFVYRLSVTLKDKVNKEVLQSAVDDIMPRFPTFNVRLCHGFFWNYFERNFARLNVKEEQDFPCRPFDLDDSESFLIRVLYRDYTISLEVFHGISDGRGALMFFNSLLARYFQRLGENISDMKGCLSYLDVPSDQEVEDSFFTYYTQKKYKRPKERPAYKIKGNMLASSIVNTIEAEMSVSEIKEVAKKYDASLSAFLAAAIGYAVYKRQTGNKPTRISIPIDLRTRFESSTLRNFSSYINVEVDGDNLKFEDVLNIFKRELSTIDKEFLQANINANVSLQKNAFVKVLPLFIKNIVMKLGFNYMGENYQTLALSNLGRVDAPREFEKYIDSYTVNLGKSKHNAKSIGIISYNDKLTMCISSKLASSQTERDIISELTSHGINVKVYSNRRDLYAAR